MADSKLTGLTANTSPALTDLTYLVDDPGGTPLSQKITVADLLAVASPTFTTPTVTTSLTVTRNAVGVTSADGIVIQNTTDAAAGAQQYSPRLRWHGEGWKTNATAASQEVDWIAEVIPVQAAANPTSQLAFSSSINGGAYSTALTLVSSGQMIFPTSGGSATVPGIQLAGASNCGIWWANNSGFPDVSITTMGVTHLKISGNEGAVTICSEADQPLIIGGQARVRGEEANVLSLRNSTNAQTFRVYETQSDSSNYERASLSCASNTVTLAAETAGTGSDDMDVALTPAGTGKVKTAFTAEVTKAGIGTTSTAGLILQNTTAADSGAQQYSPYIELKGRGYGTGGGGDKSESWILETRTFEDATTPDSLLTVSQNRNGGGITPVFAFSNRHAAFVIYSSWGLAWSSNTAVDTPDLYLYRDGAGNILAQRNTTNAQTFRVYETYTDDTNYERASLSCASNTVVLAAETAGTGSDNMDVAITPTGTGNVVFPGGVLLRTSAALTDGAAAAGGTLLNAPAAGNPTKWIPINDNGTTRYIPAW